MMSTNPSNGVRLVKVKLAILVESFLTISQTILGPLQIIGIERLLFANHGQI